MYLTNTYKSNLKLIKYRTKTIHKEKFNFLPYINNIRDQDGRSNIYFILHELELLSYGFFTNKLELLEVDLKGKKNSIREKIKTL